MKVDDAWANGAQNVLLVEPTGAGKTVISANKMAEHDNPCCAIAHRRELVSQISLGLARNKIKHRIIGPGAVIKSVVNHQMLELGKSYYDPNAYYGVAGVDTLVRRTNEFEHWLKSVTMWMQDECFPAGTIVDGIPIENIKPGDVVTAFNETSGGFEQREVVRLFKNPAPEHMVSIKIGHHVLYCTRGHPVWTNRGWVNAENITTKHKLYMVQQPDIIDKRIATLSMAKNWKDILLHRQMRVEVSGRKSKRKSKATEKNNNLFHLREACTRNLQLAKNWKSLLWERMFRRLSIENIIGNDDRYKSKTRVCKNEEKQPYEKTGNTGESIRNIEADKTQAKNTRWQWETTNKVRNLFKRVIFKPGFCRTTEYTDRSSHRRRFGIPTSIQARFGKLWVEVGNRGRRNVTRFNKTKKAGCEKRQLFKWIGVDGVTVQKRNDIKNTRGGCSDGYVYNIEVEGLHTYVADNIVVHNCHHILKDNKWGKAAAMFPNAKKGLGVTATPCRADGKGLGRHADGLMDVMIEGPTMRELINWGYLTDYRVFAPKTEDFNRAGIKVGANGDFTQDSATNAVRKSHIIGDVVKHYLRIAPGKLGITFVTDIRTAIDVAAEFNQAGVPAEVVHANTPVSERITILRKFKNRELLQLVNVDLFGEGFDLPAIEVVSMARPTQSLALFMQQFGRALRLMVSDILNASWGSYTDAQRLKFIAESVKPYAIIIDHVGNIDTTQGGHGLPDSPHVWTLNRRGKREKKQDDDVIPTRTCTSCIQIYERIHKACPWCGFAPEPASRSGPEFVDGDLTELDAATLAAMRGEVAHVDMSPEDYGKELTDKGSPRLWVGANVKRHIAKQDMQSALRLSMAWWAGYQRQAGISDDESQRRFYFMFGIDALSAKALKAKDAIVLADKINIKLGVLSK